MIGWINAAIIIVFVIVFMIISKIRHERNIR